MILLFLLLAILNKIPGLFSCDTTHNPEVEYYKELILSEIEKSKQYTFPTDNSRYVPRDGFNGPSKIYGTFDFIVVGSGSTGAVIANRLSEVSSWNILLLEAGQFGNNFTAIPRTSAFVRLSDYNWGYKSTPQTTACLGMLNHTCVYFRGRGIGGSSITNGLVYARGVPRDFDKWASQGNPGWSFDQVLPHFKQMENFRDTYKGPHVVNPEYHHVGGDLTVEYHVPGNLKTRLFLAANEEIGYKLVDYNSDQPIGASPTQVNTDHGVRADTGQAFIRPIQSRKNLKILTGAYVFKLLMERGNEVTGVRFSYGGEVFEAMASKEVILSAGAINSPQILMLSGIGPREHLEDLEIDLVADLRVGTALLDHPAFYGLTFAGNFSSADLSLEEDIRGYLEGIGPLADPENSNDAVGFYQLLDHSDHNYPDVEFMMEPMDGLGDFICKELGQAKEIIWPALTPAQSFSIYVIALHAKSSGWVKLKSKDPRDYPVMDTNLLSDKEDLDIETLYQGIKLAQKLAATKAFRRIGTTLQRQKLEQCDHLEYLSRDYWYCALRVLSSHLFHPVGSCPMGPDPGKGAVVDSQCRVHGVGRLRVADASIFPFTLSGHPNAVCMMIGARVSEMVKVEYLGEK